MRPKDIVRGAALKEALKKFSLATRPLPGLGSLGTIDSLVEQIVESMRRIEYVRLIHRMPHDPACGDPASDLFDPLIAASLAGRNGQVDEACWLVFLSVHFGKHRRSGWRLVRAVYGALGSSQRWDWERISSHPAAFGHWLQLHEARLRELGVGFGNHRKYESLKPGPRGTATAIESYVAWVHPHGDHAGLVSEARKMVGGNPGKLFDHLYSSMGGVMRFGRMAKFDFLTMLGKLELAAIEPAIPYLSGATGPLRGARLLFGGTPAAAIAYRTLDEWVAELGAGLGAGMQVMEDALCNWQKSPDRFIAFRG